MLGRDVGAQPTQQATVRRRYNTGKPDTVDTRHELLKHDLGTAPQCPGMGDEKDHRSVAGFVSGP
jgi:hypothetical protein